MAETAWAVLPPVITIVLALATKEVYMSLIIGIFSGAMLYANFNVLEAILTMFAVMEAKVGANVNILVFLVILGILVAAITRSGATKAYGDWAVRTIQGRRSALAITALLGIVIFIDDYFNCLTVGTVMRPVTDKFKIARTKLAYIIDATAAPVCILAPISSWAAAVGSSLPEGSSIEVDTGENEIPLKPQRSGGKHGGAYKATSVFDDEQPISVFEPGEKPLTPVNKP